MNHSNKEVLCEGTCEGSGEQICKIPDGEDLREVAFLLVDVRIESTRGGGVGKSKKYRRIRSTVMES